jgi:hypothetical protein
MNPAIDNIEFLSMSGAIQPPGPAVQDLDRPAYDGHATRTLARKAEPSELYVARDCEDAADAYAIARQVSDLRGQLVDARDGHGVLHAGVKILDCRVLAVRAVSGANAVCSTNALALLEMLVQVRVERE